MKNLITKQQLSGMLEAVKDSGYNIEPMFIAVNALDDESLEDGFIVTDGNSTSLVVYLDGDVDYFETDRYDSAWEEYLIEDLLEDLSGDTSS